MVLLSSCLLLAALLCAHSASGLEDPHGKLERKPMHWPSVAGLKCEELFFDPTTAGQRTWPETFLSAIWTYDKRRSYAHFAEHVGAIENAIGKPTANGNYTWGALTDTIAIGDEDVLQQREPDGEEIKLRTGMDANAIPHAEDDYPIAFSFIVFRDYLMIERLLALYLRQATHFCYAIDKKADELFKNRVRNLGRIFPHNVHVVEEEFDTNSASKSEMLRAYFACFKELRGISWHHLIQLEVRHPILYSLLRGIACWTQLSEPRRPSAYIQRAGASAEDAERSQRHRCQ